MDTNYWSKTPFEIFLEIFPDKEETELNYIAWNYTGWPCFWDGDPEVVFERQLREYKQREEDGTLDQED